MKVECIFLVRSTRLPPATCLAAIGRDYEGSCLDRKKTSAFGYFLEASFRPLLGQDRYSLFFWWQTLAFCLVFWGFYNVLAVASHGREKQRVTHYPGFSRNRGANRCEPAQAHGTFTEVKHSATKAQTRTFNIETG
jgi:hypothetical protein